MQPTKAIYLSPAIFCADLIASSVTPSQFGITSSNGTFAADLLVPNERAFAFDAARLIVNPFDYHI